MVSLMSLVSIGIGHRKLFSGAKPGLNLETFWRRQTERQRKPKSWHEIGKGEAGNFEGNSSAISCCY